MKGLTLSSRHLADLRKSGLSDETIKISGIYTESRPERIASMLNWEHPAKGLGACLAFPFPDLAGNPTSYWRVKPDEPRKPNGEPAKYESPRETPNRIYFPPLARATFNNPSKLLVITEGEKKALAADQNGFACIGLVGVYGWMKKRENPTDAKEIHPDLARFALKNRDVYIAFDSDAAFKEGVSRAEWDLATLLMEAGARVRVIRFQTALGGPKVGIDDYLRAHGKETFERKLSQSAPPCKPLFGFSNEMRRPKPDKPTEDEVVPRSAWDMAAQLVGVSKGWPRNVGGTLVVPDLAAGNRGIKSGGVRVIDGPNNLIAYAHELFDQGGVSRVNWAKGPMHVAKAELYEYLLGNCERFDRVDRLPHVPPIPGILYPNPVPVPDGKFEAIDKFLAFFSPATPEDHSLLMTALLTPFWGGSPGNRPGFLFECADGDEAAGRGVGKSTVAQKFALVAGGSFDLNANENFGRTQSRLLTPSARGYRVLLMDNVKTFRLSFADLEALITSVNINGHRLHKGQAEVMNYFTLMITLNGASLSKDLSQRLIPIHMKRAPYKAGWEAELDSFIVRNRDRVIADIVGILKSPPAKLKKVTRWGPWETEVLARVDNPSRCQDLIQNRSAEHDADREDSDRILETLEEVVGRLSRGSNLQTQKFLLTSAATTKLVGQSINEQYIPAQKASAMVKSLGIKGFRKSDRKGRRYWLFEGSAAGPKKGICVLNFDPESVRDSDGKLVSKGRWYFEDLADGGVSSNADSDE